MKRETNSSDLEKLERRLAALVPVENEELAASLLSQVQGNPFPALDSALASGQILSGANVPTRHVSCMASTLPLLTGIGGGMIGAALMFLVMTALASPKVEIREVVRYVPVEVSPPVQEIQIEDEQKSTAPEESSQPSPPETQPKMPPKSQPQAPRELPWFLAMLKPLTAFEANVTIAMNTSGDLDAMLERRAEIARQARHYEPRPLLIQYDRSNDPPSEFSPVMYKDMIENFNL